ncbi:hypothetical protein QC764_512110 [Podospora pseudoanserina]|uniref:Uncharacterized protein n=1 Tax=Podospora pseudoanserina TaxID=2609844 RepID=A0ABR0I675_9PEZI|nr:hypothetical protein QC764_512110 [Podospora pseudoanserina]
MAEAKTGGSIARVASISGTWVNFPQLQAGYNASKAAVIIMKNSLAVEWDRYGITVNTISPGYMNTILNKGEGLYEAKKIWLARNPMGRIGEREATSLGQISLWTASSATWLPRGYPVA